MRDLSLGVPCSTFGDIPVRSAPASTQGILAGLDERYVVVPDEIVAWVSRERPQ